MSNEKKLNAKEALGLIRNQYPKAKIIGGTEYDKFFVFSLVRKGEKPRKSGRYFGTGVKVNRLTGEVTGHNPLVDGWDDFRNGKTIPVEEIT